MTLENFEQSEVATRLGKARLWRTPPAADAGAVRRPLVFAMPGVLATENDLATLIANLSLLADGVMLRPPKDFGAGFAGATLAEIAAAVGEMLEREFADRQVVLLGASTGAVIALGVRARNLARIVAVEPHLVTAGLWPVLGQLGEHVRQIPEPLARDFVTAAFGVSVGGIEPRDHTAVLSGLTAPVDVVLGAEALMPERTVTRFPSLVGEAERRRLSEIPGVRLHRVPGAGHNVVGQALPKLGEIVREACRRAGRTLSPARLRLDEPLLEATPLTARRLLYCGHQGEVFADAFSRVAPSCVVSAIDLAEGETIPDGAFDVVVLGGPPAGSTLPLLAAALAPRGHLVARWRTADAALKVELAAAGLSPRDPVDFSGTGVVRAQKLAAGEAPRPALFLHYAALAPLLMDIRTRLPATGLAADPDLRVFYDTPPISIPMPPREAPKVLLIQRPLTSSEDYWRKTMARHLREGWVVAMEYDDYPPLIAEVKGSEHDPRIMRTFGFMHAIQTASPPLVELFRPFNPEVELVPNAVFDLAPFPEGPRPRRVFYGGVIRGRFAVEVAASLGPALEGLDDVEVVVIGDREVFDALPTANKRYYEYMGYEAYLELMAECTVSLSPIEALPFRDTKSDAKFLDAARAGVLTIASPTIYDRVIRHGENGLLARETTDWAPLLRQALTDEPMRERMARAAWDYVRGERMFADQAAQRRDWFWDLWARREALNEALMDRLPGLREAVAALP
ncbi:glycosyltransferase family protein [Phenylobacterium sp.]|uniref:glycosyltransferase family protein n=1 Tax=Phenylobacterium sp. TaxID=1871053 RepID=UPI002F4249FF